MKVKYNRTYHFPWSPGATSDDKILENLDGFLNKEVVLLEKMDGENSSLYTEYIHARSLESADHPSRHWLKGLWGEIRYNIPKEWRVCGENLFAQHSISYDNLPSYFMVFNIWNEENSCLSFDETLEWCKLLGLEHVPVLWRGIFDEKFIREFPIDFSKKEGYVVRTTESFHYDDFKKYVGKFVRENHVNTSEHWMFQKVVPNKLEIK